MKKGLLFVLFLVSTMIIMAQTAIQPIGGGTAGNPYIVTSWQNLWWISENPTSWDKHFAQINDITFPAEITEWNEGSGWSPIGYFMEQFTGTYYGWGCGIFDLYCNTGEAGNAGLFGVLSPTARVEQLFIINCDISGGSNIGCVAGTSLGFIDHVITMGSVMVNTECGGGIVGYNGGTVSYCSSMGSVNGIGGMLGGLVGMNDGLTELSNSDVAVHSEEGSAGGFVGWNSGLIRNCYSMGNASCENTIPDLLKIGGFVGDNDTFILNCYSTGTVTVNSTIQDSYGFCGKDSGGTIMGCFWDMDTSQATSSEGTVLGKTTAQMTTESYDLPNMYTAVGWDFVYESDNGSDDYWMISSEMNDGYPSIILMFTFYDGSLPVELSSFTASVTASSFVQIEWQTESECDLIGYNIYRNQSDELEEATKINLNYVSPHNSSSQNIYSYVDSDVETETTYNYWLESVELDGHSEFFGPVSVTLTSDEQEQEESPDVTYITGINSIYPNPFNPNTTISFSLRMAGHVEVAVFNIRGQKVRSLVNQLMSDGEHRVTWDGTDQSGKNVSNGTYLIRMNTAEESSTVKAMLLK